LLILRLSFPGLLRHPKNAWLVAELLRPARFAALAASVFSFQQSGFDIRGVETDAATIWGIRTESDALPRAPKRLPVHWPEISRPRVGRRRCRPGPETASGEDPKTPRVAIIDCSSGGITGVAPILGKESDRATGRRWPSMCAARPES
jgi:hypothetical protein